GRGHQGKVQVKGSPPRPKREQPIGKDKVSETDESAPGELEEAEVVEVVDTAKRAEIDVETPAAPPQAEADSSSDRSSAQRDARRASVPPEGQGGRSVPEAEADLAERSRSAERDARRASVPPEGQGGRSVPIDLSS